MMRRAAFVLIGFLALGLPTVAGSIELSSLFSTIKQAPADSIADGTA